MTVTSSDINGVVGILPTPSTADADRADATDTVNLSETVRMVDGIVTAGVNIILTNGTFGECATVTYEELLAFNDAVVRTTAGRVPVFAGATTLNTRDTIARGRALLDLGADGLFLGRPMWLPLDDEQVFSFYQSIAYALPNTPLVIYDNAMVFKGKLSPTCYAKLSEIPEIVAIKHLGWHPGDETFALDLEASRGQFPLLPPIDNWLPTSLEFPGQAPASWCAPIACGPEPALALRDALASDDSDTAQQVHKDLVWAKETLFPSGDVGKFMSYSIQIERAEFAAAGYIVPGPPRPPYHTAPVSYLEGGAEAGRRWAQLRKRYAAEAGGI